MGKLLVVPGPGNIPQDILEVFGKDVIHHRTLDFIKDYRNVNEKIKEIFKTENKVAIISTSGTGGMEASVVNLFSPKDKVLVINGGSFGDRYVKICEAFSLSTYSIDYRWGTTYDIEDVKKFIKENPDLKGILVTYNETSTGVLNAIAPLGELTKDTDILLVVDANSGLLVNDFQFDAWNVDCAVGCSQKGFCLPTGLSFIAISKKAERTMEESRLSKFFFDMKTYIRAYEEYGYTPFSPNTSVIRAASLALNKIMEKGLRNIQREHTELRLHVVKRVEELGLKIFSDDKASSNSGVVVDLCGKVSMKEMKKKFDEDYDITLSLGKNEFTDRAWRIGLLPPMNKGKIDYVLDLVREYLMKKGCL